MATIFSVFGMIVAITVALMDIGRSVELTDLLNLIDAVVADSEGSWKADVG